MFHHRRWASVDDWRAFRRGGLPDLDAFRTAAAISQLQAVEPLREVRDLRVLSAAETGGARGETAK